MGANTPDDHESDSPTGRHLVGWLCPSRPDGPIIPPHALTDPCGTDVPVWSDGTIGTDDNGGQDG